MHDCDNKYEHIKQIQNIEKPTWNDEIKKQTNYLNNKIGILRYVTLYNQRLDS